MLHMRLNTTRRLTIAASALAVASLLTLTGCSTDAAYRFNPTPNLDTLYERPVDAANAIALMRNENNRMFKQDLGRFFYWDRPSRLTREPIPR